MRSNNIILLLSMSLVSVHSARILAWFPFPSISHQVVFRPVTQELAKRGHEVVVITTDPVFPPGQAPPNLTEIDLHDTSYALWTELIMSNKISTGQTTNPLSVMKMIMPIVTKVIEMQVNSEEVQNLLKDKEKSFDLLMIETSGRTLLPLKQSLQVPIIFFSSLVGITTLYEAMGAPASPPLLYPTMFRQKLNNLTLVEKLLEVYHNHYQINTLFAETQEEERQLIRDTFGPDMSVDLHELQKNVDLLFLNVNPLWDHNRPVPPGVVYLGGLHLKPEKELSKVGSLGGYGDLNDIMGPPTRPPLLYPTVFKRKLNKLSIMDKLYEIYNHYRDLHIFDRELYFEEKLIKAHFDKEVPDLKILYNNID